MAPRSAIDPHESTSLRPARSMTDAYDTHKFPGDSSDSHLPTRRFSFFLPPTNNAASKEWCGSHHSHQDATITHTHHDKPSQHKPRPRPQGREGRLCTSTQRVDSPLFRRSIGTSSDYSHDCRNKFDTNIHTEEFGSSLSRVIFHSVSVFETSIIVVLYFFLLVNEG